MIDGYGRSQRENCVRRQYSGKADNTVQQHDRRKKNNLRYINRLATDHFSDLIKIKYRREENDGKERDRVKRLANGWRQSEYLLRVAEMGEDADKGERKKSIKHPSVELRLIGSDLAILTIIEAQESIMLTGNVEVGPNPNRSQQQLPRRLKIFDTSLIERTRHQIGGRGQSKNEKAASQQGPEFFSRLAIKIGAAIGGEEMGGVHRDHPHKPHDDHVPTEKEMHPDQRKARHHPAYSDSEIGTRSVQPREHEKLRPCFGNCNATHQTHPWKYT